MTLTNHFSIGHILAPKSLQPSLHGPRAATVHLIKDTPDEPIPTKAKPMNEKETRVLDQIKAHAPINRTDIAAATNISGQPLSVVLHSLKKAGHIVNLPDKNFGITTNKTPVPTSVAGKKAAAPAKKAATPKAETFAARLAREFHDTDKASDANDIESRAATMSDGRVLVIQGDRVVAELSRAQVACVKAL